MLFIDHDDFLNVFRAEQPAGNVQGFGINPELCFIVLPAEVLARTFKVFPADQDDAYTEIIILLQIHSVHLPASMIQQKLRFIHRSLLFQ